MASKSRLRKENRKKVYNRIAPYDPRVDMFKQFYLRPDSYTFMNARQSALRAGYTEQYANNITAQCPKWYEELIESADFKRSQMLKVAEDNLLKTVLSSSEDKDDKKIKHDATKFISERLGKEHYSTRKELTDKGGRRLFTDDREKDTAESISELFIGVLDDEDA